LKDVSIIIPTYNRLWSLPKALESCRETSLDIEIIVVDDGSNDGTWEWLGKQPGVISIFQSNAGKDWAVNRALATATGRYVRFLDSDDWFLPNSTDKLFEEAEKSQADVVCAGYQVFAGDSVIRDINWIDCDDFLAQQLGECDSSHYSAYLFKFEFIADIPHRQEYGALDDRKFVIEVAMKFPRVSHLKIFTLVHHFHDQERLQKPSGLQETADHLARLKIYRNAFARLAEMGELTQRRKNAACNILWHMAHWVAKTHIAEGENIYRWVYELNPDFVPDEESFIYRLYKLLGFKRTEKILHTRRLLKS
jgi:glycosyltransferase involved in cell wall biosynthesis